MLVLENVKTPIYTDSSSTDYNLFQVLQKYVVKSGGEKMENQNLVVARRQSGGFYILSGTGARGESLLDESCPKW